MISTKSILNADFDSNNESLFAVVVGVFQASSAANPVVIADVSGGVIDFALVQPCSLEFFSA